LVVLDTEASIGVIFRIALNKPRLAQG